MALAVSFPGDGPTNHSSEARKAACRAVLPRAWHWEHTGNMPVPPADGEWSSTEILGKQEGQMELRFRVPADAKPGRCVVPVDVRYHDRVLPQFTEAIVVV